VARGWGRKHYKDRHMLIEDGSKRRQQNLKVLFSACCQPQAGQKWNFFS
jgi:hypothetical protein